MNTWTADILRQVIGEKLRRASTIGDVWLHVEGSLIRAALRELRQGSVPVGTAPRKGSGYDSFDELVKEVTKLFRCYDGGRESVLAEQSNSADRNSRLAAPVGLAADAPQETSSPFVFTRGEMARAWAYSVLLANEALRAIPVRQFRSEFLGGKVLTREEAHSFMHSPALARCTVDQLHQHGIPYLGHSVTLLDETFRSAKYPGHPRFKIYWRATLRDENTGKVLRLVLEEPFGRGPGIRFPDYDEHDGEPRTSTGYAHYQESSVFSALHEVAKWLVQRYPWSEASAVGFVLYNLCPFVPPIDWSWSWSGSAADHLDMRVTLKLDPGFSAVRLGTMWREMQEHFRPGHRVKERGKKGQARCYEALHFVANAGYDVARSYIASWNDSLDKLLHEYEGQPRTKVPWTTLYRAWEAQCKSWAAQQPGLPDNTYKGGTKRFRRDVERAWEELMLDPYEWANVGPPELRRLRDTPQGRRAAQAFLQREQAAKESAGNVET